MPPFWRNRDQPRVTGSASRPKTIEARRNSSSVGSTAGPSRGNDAPAPGTPCAAPSGPARRRCSGAGRSRRPDAIGSAGRRGSMRSMLGPSRSSRSAPLSEHMTTSPALIRRRPTSTSRTPTAGTPPAPPSGSAAAPRPARRAGSPARSGSASSGLGHQHQRAQREHAGAVSSPPVSTPSASPASSWSSISSPCAADQRADQPVARVPALLGDQAAAGTPSDSLIASSGA